jgi:hypothetical protein
MPFSAPNSNVARQPHSLPQSTLVSPLSLTSLLQCVAKQVSPARPTFLPLPETQLVPLAHWSFAVHTPSALEHGHSFVQARSSAASQSGPFVHTASLVDVPGFVSSWVARHSIQGTHVAWFAVLVNVPASQSAHSRSVLAVGAFACRRPASHVVSSKHSPFDSYCPAPHVEQTRSEVAVGGTLSLSPGRQVVRGSQALPS